MQQCEEYDPLIDAASITAVNNSNNNTNLTTTPLSSLTPIALGAIGSIGTPQSYCQQFSAYQWPARTFTTPPLSAISFRSSHSPPAWTFADLDNLLIGPYSETSTINPTTSIRTPSLIFSPPTLQLQQLSLTTITASADQQPLLSIISQQNLQNQPNQQQQQAPFVLKLPPIKSISRGTAHHHQSTINTTLARFSDQQTSADRQSTSIDLSNRQTTSKEDTTTGANRSQSSERMTTNIQMQASSPNLAMTPRPGDNSQGSNNVYVSPTQVNPAYQMASSRAYGSAMCCEVLLLILSGVIFTLTLPFSLFFTIKVVQEYERAVIFRLGRLNNRSATGPGLFFILPCIDKYRSIDLRTKSYDVPPQEILTRDSVTVAVDAVVYYRIRDASIAITNVEDYQRSTNLLAATTLRTVLGTKSLAEILSDRESISLLIGRMLDEATGPWGVKVERVEVKDVRLPVQMQRAMAAEAEANREARAKVIAAEGEQKASRALKEAASIMSDSPTALQLRYLQTLHDIAAEKNSTIVFPLPVEMLTAWLPMGHPHSEHRLQMLEQAPASEQA